MANYLQWHKFHTKQSARIISSFRTFDLFVLFPTSEFERNGKLAVAGGGGGGVGVPAIYGLYKFLPL